MRDKKLPTTAYELREGEQYVPFTHGRDLTEVTFKAVASGIVHVDPSGAVTVRRRACNTPSSKPLTKRPESSEPNFFASSIASSTMTTFGTLDSCSIS